MTLSKKRCPPAHSSHWPRFILRPLMKPCNAIRMPRCRRNQVPLSVVLQIPIYFCPFNLNNFSFIFFTFRVIKKRIYIEFCVIALNFSFGLFRCEITMQNQTAVTDPELDQDVDKICVYVTPHPNSFFLYLPCTFCF